MFKQAKVQNTKELSLKVVCQPFQTTYKARILKYLFDTKPLFIPGKQICNQLIKLVFSALKVNKLDPMNEFSLQQSKLLCFIKQWNPLKKRNNIFVSPQGYLINSTMF